MASGIGGEAVDDIVAAQAALQGDVQDEHQTDAFARLRRLNLCKEHPVIRVAQVAPNIFPVPPNHHGGTERVVHDLCVALRSLGIEITLFCAIGQCDRLTSHRRLSELVGPRTGARPRRAGCPRSPGCPAIGGTSPPSGGRSTSCIAMASSPMRAARAHRRRSLTTVHWRVDELDRALFFAGFPDLPVAAISAAQEAGIPAANRAGVVHHGIDRTATRSRPAGRPRRLRRRMTDQKRPDVAIRVARAAGVPIRLGGTIDVGNPEYFDRQVRPLLGPDAPILAPWTTPPRAPSSRRPAPSCSPSTGPSRSAS